MSKQRHAHSASPKPHGSPAQRVRRNQYLAWIGLALGAAAIVGLALLRDKPLAPLPRPQPEARAGSQAAATSAGTNAAAPVRAQPGFSKLKGKWLRPDGDYALEVRDIGGDGRVEAAYFNPDPIHVERAEARQDGAALELSVELRDTNYPGCIYKLRYDAASDRLEGTYFQAALGETYDVMFVRSP